MTTPMTALEIERLAFVRFLFDQGIAQARQPEPLSATAVLSFHDAVEQFLRLAADHLGVSLPRNVTFTGYWSEIEPHTPGQAPLPSKPAMNRMNNLRVAFKHHGTFPSKTAIEQSRSDTVTFFTDAVPLVFGIDFESVDMLNLVAHPQVATTLRAAQGHADKGNLPMAMAGLMIAFIELLDHYGERGTYDNKQPFRFGPSITPTEPLLADPVTTALSKVLSPMSQALGAMQTAMRIIALGIDYSRYAQFDVLCPKVSRHYSGPQCQYHFHATEAQNRTLTRAHFEFGRHFVIEAALQAARAEAALQTRDEHRAINSPEPGTWHSGTHHVWKAPENE
ncbi:hypothetical protein ACIQUD_29510 [Streptomyces globisporus]|uniref:hypothetical protein n=1 Tax=Streptomyces globisporus TaxID=1908 RepID=UPI00380E1A3B